MEFIGAMFFIILFCVIFSILNMKVYIKEMKNKLESIEKINHDILKVLRNNRY